MDREIVEYLNRSNDFSRDIHFRTFGTLFVGIVLGSAIVLLGIAVGKSL